MIGQQRNCIGRAAGNAPIHFNLYSYDKATFASLLRSGAIPNLPNKDGLTALHYICKEADDDDVFLMKLLFEISDSRHQLDHVNTQDNSGKTPLYYATTNCCKPKMIQMLLKRGANPNLADVEGLTPLHKICLRFDDDNCVDDFFKFCDDNHQLVQVDARDKLDRTPLHCAVMSFLPHVVDVLLDRGADLTSFVFPTESEFETENGPRFKSKLAFGAVGVVESLEKKGYKLNDGDALTIMKLFAKYELFGKSTDMEKMLHDNEEFVNKVKNLLVFPRIKLDNEKKREARKIKKRLKSPILSLYDLLSQPEEAKKQYAYKDFFSLGFSAWCVNNKHFKEAHALHLCEKMSRRFFLRYALYPFLELIHYRFPIEMCEIVMKHLKNQDLYNICLAVSCLRDKGNTK
ncbi:ankyrin-3-like [Trichogramma pretiosum]|uniref:ankyrin-3-like n=1 Tax=Trichogramma pretiosum TaxID=7493 RepID=UPI000C71AD1B|nr:ankyrin-3-like [Trichogramma pretiosum]